LSKTAGKHKQSVLLHLGDAIVTPLLTAAVYDFEQTIVEVSFWGSSNGCDIHENSSNGLAAPLPNEQQSFGKISPIDLPIIRGSPLLMYVASDSCNDCLARTLRPLVVATLWN
jgi:hypothetical protein